MKGADNTRFANVVLPHLDDAYALARWVMGNRADAEDVVQEACLRALRGISGYSGANGRAWTLAIVRNAAYDWLRKNRPAALVPVEDLESAERVSPRDHAAATPPVDPETALIAKSDWPGRAGSLDSLGLVVTLHVGPQGSFPRLRARCLVVGDPVSRQEQRAEGVD